MKLYRSNNFCVGYSMFSGAMCALIERVTRKYVKVVTE